MSSIRGMLRENTRRHHDAVDALIARLDLDTKDGYACLLRLHGAVVLPAENSLESFGIRHLLTDWPERARSRALSADLADLNVPAPGRGSTLPFALTAARAAGTLYVLEGSKLGSTILRERLDQRSGVTRSFPRRFLRHGAGAGSWQRFVRWLNGQRLNAAQVADAIEAATAIFALYEAGATRMLDERGVLVGAV